LINNNCNWIPASAGMTPLLPNYDTVSQGGGSPFSISFFPLSPGGRG
jgi:hypothetical protein